MDKLLSTGFIALVEEISWLLLIVVIPKRNDKLKFYVDFRWLNVATKKKDPYPLPFIEEVLDEVSSHEVYSFLDGFFGYHQIMIVPKDMYKIAFIIDWGTFVWVILPFGFKDVPPTYQWAMNMAFKDYLGMFMKLFLDDFNVFNNLDTIYKATIMFWKM